VEGHAGPNGYFLTSQATPLFVATGAIYYTNVSSSLFIFMFQTDGKRQLIIGDAILVLISQLNHFDFIAV
jgi:hypothetical protein